jgi:hypothetical protein
VTDAPTYEPPPAPPDSSEPTAVTPDTSIPGAKGVESSNESEAGTSPGWLDSGGSLDTPPPAQLDAPVNDTVTLSDSGHMDSGGDPEGDPEQLEPVGEADQVNSTPADAGQEGTPDDESTSGFADAGGNAENNPPIAPQRPEPTESQSIDETDTQLPTPPENAHSQSDDNDDVATETSDRELESTAGTSARGADSATSEALPEQAVAANERAAGSDVTAGESPSDAPPQPTSSEPGVDSTPAEPQARADQTSPAEPVITSDSANSGAERAVAPPNVTEQSSSDVGETTDAAVREAKAVELETPAGSAYYGLNDIDMREAAEELRPEAGYFTVDMHGSANDSDHVFFENKNGEMQSLNAQQLAQAIKENPDWNGQPVRLFACYTGQDPPNGGATFGQQLANSLGVDVKAPTSWVSNDVNGNPVLNTRNRGEWRAFHPGS